MDVRGSVRALLLTSAKVRWLTSNIALALGGPGNYDSLTEREDRSEDLVQALLGVEDRADEVNMAARSTLRAMLDPEAKDGETEAVADRLIDRIGVHDPRMSVRDTVITVLDQIDMLRHTHDMLSTSLLGTERNGPFKPFVEIEDQFVAVLQSLLGVSGFEELIDQCVSWINEKDWSLEQGADWLLSEARNQNVFQ